MLGKGSFSVDNGTADCNERGQCNFTSAGDLQRAPTASPTPSPVAAPTSPPTSTDSSSSSSATATGSVIIGVVVFIVILVAIVALFLVYRSKKAKQDDHKVVSFENPMYDDTENVASAAAGNDGGYMDVPMKHNPTFNESDEEDNHGGNGYLDVQPNGEDEDEDDNEEDI